MKAPNGKPTNLTEKQWLQVRTKAFKDWFGDWENDIKRRELPERVLDIRNRVFEKSGLGLGKKNPNKFQTKEDATYRITGQSQVNDIIETGYVRPPKGKLKGGRTNEVHWARGEENLVYTDTERFILETKGDINESTTAVSIDDLSAIWQFVDGEWRNMLSEIRSKHNNNKKETSSAIDERRNKIKESFSLTPFAQGNTQSPKVESNQTAEDAQERNTAKIKKSIDGLNDLVDFFFKA